MRQNLQKVIRILPLAEYISMAQKLINIISSPILPRVFSAGLAGGGVVGFKDCQLGEIPLINERLMSAAYVGLTWGSLTVLSPLIALAKLECTVRGREMDILGLYKEAHRVGTGSYRNRKYRPKET